MPSLRSRLGGLWRHPSRASGELILPAGAAPRAAGEQGLADQPMRQPVVAATSWWPTYALNDVSQPNYAKTRALFYNRLPPYRLGAGFARPIINAASGFTGVPTPSPVEDAPDAQEFLQDQWELWLARLYLATRNSFRDGDAFVRITRDVNRLDKRQSAFNLKLLRPDRVFPELDPISGEWLYLDVHHYVTPPRDSELKEPYLLVERIEPEQITLKLPEGQHAPPDAEQRYGGEGLRQPNPWGLIPIVQLRNEAEEDALWGTSDLEPLDALFRAYHDTLLTGLGGIQLFAKPKIKLRVGDRVEFLRQNFPEALAGQPINFQGREVIILNGSEEDALYITADPGTAGVQTLLELLFFQIVQVSETPEFVFGTAVASSKASVSEQQVPFAKKVHRKRLQLAEPMQEIAAMYLSMGARVGLFPDLAAYDCDLEWPEVNPRDEQALANTLKARIDAFIAAIDAHIVSVETANEYLRPFIPAMLEWTNPEEQTDEQRRILEGLEFLDTAANVGAPPPPQGAPGSQLEALLRANGLPVQSAQTTPTAPSTNGAAA